jgi:hypothetical protein
MGLDDAEAVKFPMRVGEFLALPDQLLNRGDIVLSRSPTLSSWAIRKFTGSFFSHAALIFLVPQPSEGFNNAFLLESTGGGVGLANLKGYVGGKRPAAEIAILRLEGPQFDEHYFKQVRGLMLDHVKTEYDYARILRLGLSLNFGFRFGWSTLAKGKREGMREAIKRTRKRVINWVPPQFICSGFIQYGFVEALRRQSLPADPAIFKSGLDEKDRDGILAVTPEDIAQSHRLTWKYAIRRGWVYEVSSYSTAQKIISGG